MQATFDSNRSDAPEQLDLCLAQLRRNVLESGKPWTLESRIAATGAMVTVRFAEPTTPESDEDTETDSDVVLETPDQPPE